MSEPGNTGASPQQQAEALFGEGGSAAPAALQFLASHIGSIPAALSGAQSQEALAAVMRLFAKGEDVHALQQDLEAHLSAVAAHEVAEYESAHPEKIPCSQEQDEVVDVNAYAGQCVDDLMKTVVGAEDEAAYAGTHADAAVSEYFHARMAVPSAFTYNVDEWADDDDIGLNKIPADEFAQFQGDEGEPQMAGEELGIDDEADFDALITAPAAPVQPPSGPNDFAAFAATRQLGWEDFVRQYKTKKGGPGSPTAGQEQEAAEPAPQCAPFVETPQQPMSMPPPTDSEEDEFPGAMVRKATPPRRRGGAAPGGAGVRQTIEEAGHTRVVLDLDLTPDPDAIPFVPPPMPAAVTGREEPIAEMPQQQQQEAMQPAACAVPATTLAVSISTGSPPATDHLSPLLVHCGYPLHEYQPAFFPPHPMHPPEDIERADHAQVLNLKVYCNPHRTGFEESKEFPVVIGSMIAGRYQVIEYLGSAAFSKALQCLDTQRDLQSPPWVDVGVLQCVCSCGDITACYPPLHDAATSPPARSATPSNPFLPCSLGLFLPCSASHRPTRLVRLLVCIKVCIKVIKNSKDFLDQSLDEIKLLQYINEYDPTDANHIVRLYDYFYYKEHLFIVCELLRDNLYEFQRYNRESGHDPYFTIPRLQLIARQVLESLAYIHSLNLVHCDLKPENILIKSYSRCEVKVIDFGSSCFVNDHLSLYVQSRSYRAPEVILGLPYGQKIDIWSLGCIMAEMWTGRVLFLNDTLPTLLGRITAMIGPFPAEMLAQGRYTNKYFTKSGHLFEQPEVAEGAAAPPEASSTHILLPKRTNLAHRLHCSDALFVDFVAKLLTVDPAKRWESETYTVPLFLPGDQPQPPTPTPLPPP
ncbi:putative Serine/threonine-protein kinase ppk5 [Paratrimastix pyriformis]|uniref:Serine/threonine-protein kinase ppk5 n=1 Tax=Paratrimastix pyriformis TaxID=342808 RepID=A0ABQ8U8J0_9EUKA|nr:putative Serine/threonine-protein kinase ppk5 [Paratrimastix pyriformis]